MKVLFLDIDGVLNNPGCWGPVALWRQGSGDQLQLPIAPECMIRLNRIVAETGVRIVISSSWRLFARFEDLGPALVRYGLVGEVIGETPALVNNAEWLMRWRTREGAPFTYERMERGWEIREWIAAHPEVEAFVILDDCCDMAELRPWLVHTDPVIGLDDPDVERAKYLLADSARGIALARQLAIGYA